MKPQLKQFTTQLMNSKPAIILASCKLKMFCIFISENLDQTMCYLIDENLRMLCVNYAVIK